MDSHDRVCRDCGLEGAPLDQYVASKPSRYGHRNLCKPCRRVREGKTRFSPAPLNALKRWLIRGASSGPCTDCGMWPEDPCQMDFDHVFGDKVCEVSQMTTTYSMDAIVFEIAKCELVCANCHRLRTRRRLAQR